MVATMGRKMVSLGATTCAEDTNPPTTEKPAPDTQAMAQAINMGRYMACMAPRPKFPALLNPNSSVAAVTSCQDTANAVTKTVRPTAATAASHERPMSVPDHTQRSLFAQRGKVSVCRATAHPTAIKEMSPAPTSARQRMTWAPEAVRTISTVSR